MKFLIFTMTLVLSFNAYSGMASDCIDSGAFICDDKPGIEEGLQLSVLKDFEINLGWTYFVEGNEILKDDLLLKEGQAYCAVAVAKENGSHLLPKDLKIITKVVDDTADTEESVVEIVTAKIPSDISPYEVLSLSWYGPTFFMQGLYNDQTLGLAFYCGEIKEGSFSSPENSTSLDSLLKHFKTYIELVE